MEREDLAVWSDAINEMTHDIMITIEEEFKIDLQKIIADYEKDYKAIEKHLISLVGEAITKAVKKRLEGLGIFQIYLFGQVLAPRFGKYIKADSLWNQRNYRIGVDAPDQFVMDTVQAVMENYVMDIFMETVEDIIDPWK